METLKLSGSFGDERTDLLRLCTELRPVTNKPDVQSWVFDLREVEKLGAFAASVLGAVYLSAVERGLRLSVHLPDGSPSLRSFAKDTGLEDLVATGVPAGSSSPRHTYVPLIQFFDSPWFLGDSVVALLGKYKRIDGDFEDYLRICISEAAQNVIDHAQSTVGGVMCCRYNEPDNRVSVCICDLGIGIAGSLQLGGKDMATFTQTLREKAQRGITSKSRPTNQGLGIRNMLDAVTGCGGDLVLLSSGHSFTIDTSVPFLKIGDGLVPRPPPGRSQASSLPRHRSGDFHARAGGMIFTCPIS